MHSFSADPANFHYTTRIHPALTSFADEVCSTLARLLAYLMTLALLTIVAIGAWGQLLDATITEPSDRGAWSLADRASRAFAVVPFDSHDKTEAYEIIRHPLGDRRDLLRWRRSDRVASGTPALSSDWLTEAGNPPLRGAF